MITELRLRDFKNFKDATLRLGPFTVLVGANASGKSNIRDALRFLHGVGRMYTLAEIIGGKYGAGGQLEWAPLRGGANEIIRLGAHEFAIDATLASESPEARQKDVSVSRYHIGAKRAGIIDGGGFGMSAEALESDGTMIYSSHPGGDKLSPNNRDPALFQVQMATPVTQRKGTIFGVPGDEPVLAYDTVALHQDPENRSRTRGVREALGGIRFLDLMPDRMRMPAFPGQNVLGDSGENLSTVLWELCQTSERKAILIDWIQELTPMDIVDFEFPRDPSGLIHLLLKERSGITISAFSASDGTLRFLALLAALLGTHPAKLYFIEEIEAGIHPSRLRLLLDLIEHQTAKSGIQVVATTHSPDLLQMISDSTFNHASVVYRPRDTDHAIIRPIGDLPNAPRLRKEQGLGPLLASGWMEDVLFFDGENAQAAAK
jgi:predicted ATPase